MRLNWNEIKRLYVYGGDSPMAIGKPNKATGKVHLPSYDEIANFYNAHIQTIAKRARRENWVDLRKFTQEEISKKTEERLKEMQIKSLSEVNAENYKIASAVQSTFLKQMQDGKTSIYAGDALAWSKLKQEISEKVSGVEDDSGTLDINIHTINEGVQIDYINRLREFRKVCNSAGK